MENRIKIERIGIDIDDVMNDFLPHFLIFYNKRHGTGFSAKDFKSYKYCETLGCTNEEAVEAVNEFCKTPEFDSLKPVEGCKETVELLSKKSQIYAITSRHPWLKQKTIDFFQKHFSEIQIPAVHIGDFFGGGKTKSELCDILGIPLIIEDNEKYALECANSGIYSILFDKPWNAGISHENIIRANSWKEIPGIIYSLEGRLLTK